MKEFIARFKAPTPAFFKKMQVFGTSLASLGISLQAISGVPEKIKNVGVNLIVAGGVIVAVAQFAQQNVNPIEPSKPETNA